MNDYYSMLGVRREASPSEITATYRNILREKFQKAGYSFLYSDVTQAYRTLSHPQKRKEYDLLLQKVVGKYLVPNPDNPDPADKKYQSGLNAIEQKRFQDAVDFFTQAIKIDPEKSHFYSQLGLALGMFNGRLAEAERYCKKAIDLEPDNPELCYNLGFLYQRHNLVEAAQQAFLQAQQAEQKRWGSVFNPGSAVIELQWSEDEDRPITEPEPIEEELPETAEPAPADGPEEFSEASDLDKETEITEPLGAAPKEPREDETIDDFDEPIILNDGPSLETSDTDSLAEEISENMASETPAISIPEKSQAEPEISYKPISTGEADSGDQVIMAQILDDEHEYLSTLEMEGEKLNAPEIVPDIRNKPAGSETESQNGLDIVSNAVDDTDSDGGILTGSDSVEPGVAGGELPQAEDQLDYGMVVDDASPQAGPGEESGRDDSLLKDLESLEAELAEVDASSGIGSGDNGLLLEMKGHQDIFKSSPTDASSTDQPRAGSIKPDDRESVSLDDLEDEALSLLRELGLNPSEYVPEDSVETNPKSPRQETESADTVEQSESGESETEAEPDHDDLEELKKIEEMERKMAEELELLKQEREKLKKRKKKKQ